jgi:hypothetical protein
MERKKRRKTAQKLPVEIDNEVIPKYVVYYCECYNKSKKLFREFFKIEAHPKITRFVCSSKSSQISLIDKLNQIKDALNNITTKNKILPKYYRISSSGTNQYIVYDRRVDNKRYNMKMKLPAFFNITVEFKRFNDKLYEKYN